MELGEGSRGSVNCYIGELITGGQRGAGGREQRISKLLHWRVDHWGTVWSWGKGTGYANSRFVLATSHSKVKRVGHLPQKH